AMAYDATYTIIIGLKQSNTRTELQQVLSSPGFSAAGATGVIQFLPSGDRKRSATLVKVVPNSQSVTGYHFVPVMSR
ncbi:MAG: ABC transporter substrate-binding protein, partial [Scytonema sp. PMC 1069.18]|nr:ABC transporter substrate-binding protein [Scytonema sp. PMC 1069.18]